MIEIAIADAKKNCDRDGATAIVSLNSGIQYQGTPEALPGNFVHMRLSHGGWVTIAQAEIAAVESKPKELF